MNQSDYLQSLKDVLDKPDANSACYNAVTEWRYIFDGVSAYTLNVCSPTDEAKRHSLKQGATFFVNGDKYVFDGQQAEREANIIARQIQADMSVDEKVMRQARKLFDKRDKNGLAALLPKIQHPRSKQWIEQSLDWLK